MLNKVLKKSVAALAAVTLAFTAATPATVVSAAKKAKTVKVVYSVSEGPHWMLAPKTLTVSADLDDRYAELTGYTDDSDVPTMLDATIAAHIEVYDDEMPGLEVTSGDYGAYITCAFRLDTSAIGYFINDAQDNGEGDYYNLDTELKNGDEIRFFFYQDTENYSDTYVFFDKTDIKGKKGSKATLTAYYYGYDEAYNMVKKPAEGLDISYNGKAVGTTDKNGKVQFKIKKKGLVVADGTLNGAEIVKAYCNVKKSK